MLDLTKILMDAPQGTKLYCPIVGEVIFEELLEPDNNEYGYVIITRTETGRRIYFTKYGQYSKNAPDTECVLFPSKETRSWEDVTFEPKRQDAELYTPMVTFDMLVTPLDIRIMYYAGKGKCFIGHKDGPAISVPHAVPVSNFNFETLSWDPNDDYANVTASRKFNHKYEMPSLIKEFLASFKN